MFEQTVEFVGGERQVDHPRRVECSYERSVLVRVGDFDARLFKFGLSAGPDRRREWPSDGLSRGIAADLPEPDDTEFKFSARHRRTLCPFSLSLWSSFGIPARAQTEDGPRIRRSDFPLFVSHCRAETDNGGGRGGASGSFAIVVEIVGVGPVVRGYQAFLEEVVDLKRPPVLGPLGVTDADVLQESERTDLDAVSGK